MSSLPKMSCRFGINDTKDSEFSTPISFSLLCHAKPGCCISFFSKLFTKDISYVRKAVGLLPVVDELTRKISCPAFPSRETSRKKEK